MNGLWKYFVLGLMVTSLPASIMVLRPAKNEQVLSSVITNTPIPTKLPTPKATPTPSPSPTIAPNPIPTPKPISSEEINKLIERFAGQYGVEPEVLRYIAICESGFNPNAVNGAYVGLYQFGPITWATNRVIIGESPDPTLRLNAEESIQTAAYMLKTKGREFWPNCQP